MDRIEHDQQHRALRPVHRRVGRTVVTEVPFTTSGSTYGLAIAVGALTNEEPEVVIRRLVEELATEVVL